MAKNEAKGKAGPVIILSALVTLVLAVSVLLVIIGGGYLLHTGYFQSPTKLLVKIKPTQAVCGDEVTYSVELQDKDGNGLGSQNLAVYSSDVLFEKLKTDQNGRVSSTFDVPASWCGKKLNFTIRYDGDYFHKRKNGTVTLAVLVPTTLTFYAPDNIVAREETKLSALLKSSVNSTPLSNFVVTFYYGEKEVSIFTDATGSAEASVFIAKPGKTKLSAKYSGDESHVGSESAVSEVDVLQQSCPDGTIVAECSSKQKGYYCDDNKLLAFNCVTCGCPESKICKNAACITQEQYTTQLISSLQSSLVFISHRYATGSGVVLQQENGQTIILTNKHVIADADSIGSVSIKDNEGRSASVYDIRYAPSSMDLAVIYVQGLYGTPAAVDYSGSHQKGEEVLALGSPLGLQGSVSEGIISNFQDAATGSGYAFKYIQTDAAINPGNSGGGLFLKSNGDLIGINSMKRVGENVEGLGFAIDTKELTNLRDYDSWDRFTPTPRCSDGTKYGECSTFYAGKMCASGQLIAACSQCGCPANLPYCASSGYKAETCFSCPSGYSAYKDGGCCPAGFPYFGNGNCCQPGYYYVGGGACCPNGTYLGGDGKCYY